MSASTYLRRALLGHAFGGDAMTLPTEWWVQLHDGEPAPDCLYSAVSGIPREQLALWTEASAGTSESNDPILFESIAEGCTVSHLSIWSEEDAGNPLLYCQLEDPTDIAAGEDAQFVATAIATSVSGLTIYAADKFIGLVCNGTSWTRPSEWWVQLHDGDPGADYTDNIFQSRKEVDWSDVTSSQAEDPDTGEVISTVYVESAEDVIWSDVEAATITHFSVWDSEVGGNCIYSEALAPQQVIPDGQSIVVLAGSLVVRMTETYNPNDVPSEEEDSLEFRHVIEDFNDWEVVHDEAWLATQTPGTTHRVFYGKGDSKADAMELGIGEGRDGSNALRVKVQPVITEQASCTFTSAGATCTVTFPSPHGQTSVPSGSRLTITATTNATGLPNGVYTISSLPTTSSVVISLGTTRTGSGSCTAAGHNLPGFWCANYRPTWTEPSGDDMYFIPRGLNPNYLEMYIRFSDGYRVSTDPDNGSETFHLGTYHADPGRIYAASGVEETSGWHFYYQPTFDYSTAAGGWIKARFGLKPDHKRSVNLYPYGQPSNPTTPCGNLWSLLTRWYFDAVPYYYSPECAYPYYMLVDEIAVGYATEPEDISISFNDGFINGQVIKAQRGQPYTFAVSITNTSDETISGYVYGTSYWSLGFSFKNEDMSPVVNPVTFTAGQTRQYRIYTSSLGSNTSFEQLYVSFIPSTVAVYQNESDSLHYTRTPTTTGRHDGHVYTALIHLMPQIGPVVSQVATMEGGIILECSEGTSISRRISSQYPNGTVSPITIVTPPTEGGTVSVVDDNLVIFSADPGYSGTTWFEYTCTDYYSYSGATKTRAWVVVN